MNVKRKSPGYGAPRPVTVPEAVEGLTPESRAVFLARFDMKNFAKVFEDGEICETCLTFFGCRLNVSRTARKMYMHRNTLIYRLDKVRETTGLDLREFDSAFTFALLYAIYNGNRSKEDE